MKKDKFGILLIIIFVSVYAIWFVFFQDVIQFILANAIDEFGERNIINGWIGVLFYIPFLISVGVLGVITIIMYLINKILNQFKSIIIYWISYIFIKCIISNNSFTSKFYFYSIFVNNFYIFNFYYFLFSIRIHL